MQVSVTQQSHLSNAIMGVVEHKINKHKRTDHYSLLNCWSSGSVRRHANGDGGVGEEAMAESVGGTKGNFMRSLAFGVEQTNFVVEVVASHVSRSHAVIYLTEHV